MKKANNQEVMEIILREIKDPKEREKVITFITDNKESISTENDLLDKMGVDLKGVRKNIKIYNFITVLVGFLLFLLGVIGFIIDSSKKTPGAFLMFLPWIIFPPIFVVFNLKFLNNFLKNNRKQ